MSNLEERISELERRISVLEAGVVSGSHSSPLENPPQRESVVSVAVSNKRFDPTNANLGQYEDHIWFDCTYTLSAASKSARAVKGVLKFADLFGEVKFQLQVTLNDGLVPGRPMRQSGIGFTYNQFIGEHQWMLVTDLRDMACSFHALNVIYSDGSTESFA